MALLTFLLFLVQSLLLVNRYPQPHTLLRIDNTVAIGLARGSINAKRSKSMAMRFFWLADRVKQNHFIVDHIPGIWNVADHFTKPLPKGKFYHFFQYLAVNMDNEPQPNRLKSVTVTIYKIKWERVCCIDYNTPST